MHELHLTGDTPQPDRVGHKPEQRAQSPNARDESWPVWSIDLDKGDFCSFAREQLRELPRLVGHAPRGGRQRTNETDLETGQDHCVARPSEAKTAR